MHSNNQVSNTDFKSRVSKQKIRSRGKKWGRTALTLVEDLHMILKGPVFELPLFTQDENGNNPIPILGLERRWLVPDLVRSHHPIPAELLLNSDAVGLGGAWPQLLDLGISRNEDAVLKKLLDIVDGDEGLEGAGDEDDGHPLPDLAAL